ncbi:MAG: lasso peptide biosynthesis B2 protein [Acidimicrobiales bacterium]
MTMARLQLRAATLVVLAQILRRLRGTTHALRRLHRIRRPTIPVDPAAAMLAVQRAGRVARARCLAQSVALAALLDQEAHDIVVVLGCRLYADGRWGSHAWVLYGGQMLEPVTADEHTPLARYSAEHNWVPVAPPAAPRVS